MRRLALAVMVLSVSAKGVLAGFVSNYSDWKTLNAREQQIYAIGLYELLVGMTPAAPLPLAIHGAKMGLRSPFTGKMLSEVL